MDPPTVFRHLDRVRPLPELRTSADDWTGVTSKQERKRRQNRMHQRAWRKRQAGTGTHTQSGSRTIPPRSTSHAGISSPHPTGKDGPLLLPDPRFAEEVQGLMQQALIDHSLHVVRPSNLHVIIRLNVLNAIADNATLIGFPKEGFCRDDFMSPFYHAGPAQPGAIFFSPGCPSSLHPTALQQSLPHHPWIDLFPFPAFRDNVLLALQSGEIDDDKLCYELIGVGEARPGEQPSLLVWTEAWDPRGWEVNAEFVRKWGMLLKGCPEILQATNYWRSRRGQAALTVDRNIVEVG